MVHRLAKFLSWHWQGEKSVPRRSVQQERNYTQTGGEARLTYALMPGLRPFADVAVDQRVHDVEIDFNGFRRNSTGITARAGVALNIGTISGDVSTGYLLRRAEDPLLPNVGGMVLDATLKAELRQEWTRSNEAVNNFAATAGLIGVRLQY
jgi:hypothetical protein